MDAVYGIGFDLDHTLAIDNRLERVAFLRLLEVVLAEGGRSLGTLSEEIDSIDDLLQHQRCGEFSIDEAVHRFVEARGIAARDAHVEWFRKTAVALVDDMVVPLPGVRRTLETLRERGATLAVLTNGWNPMQRRKAERTGFRGPILVSSELGVQKPAAGSFEALLRTLATPRQQSWYVGDDPHGDVAGAQAAGMRTVWIDWERKEYPTDVKPPDRTVHSFEELLEVLPVPARAT